MFVSLLIFFSLQYMLKLTTRVNFLEALEDYVTTTIFVRPNKYLTADRNFPENQITKKYINILYFLCKQSKNIRDRLVKHPELVYILRSIWNCEEFQFLYISQKTKEFSSHQVYKQLAFCLLEVFKHTISKQHKHTTIIQKSKEKKIIEDIKLVYELMKAPIEQIPGSFEFLTSYLENNEEIANKFKEMFFVFLDMTKRKNIIPARDLTKIPLTVSIQFATKLSQVSEQGATNFPELHKSTLYSENVQIKAWRYILLPSFKIFCDKEKQKQSNTEILEIHSKFVERLTDYKSDEVSEDLTVCLVQFSCLLLKHISSLER